jgi:biopolymer transport protein TolR
VAAPLLGQAGRGRGTRRYRPLSEINVTPFVDVMLVLLIVFMVTAPLLTVGVPVDLPKTEAAQLTDEVEPVVVSINADGQIFVMETPLAPEQLVARLRAITRAREDNRVYVRGDKGIAYGRVLELMGMISAAGFFKVALVAEIPDAPLPATTGDSAPGNAAPGSAPQRN